MEPISIGKSLTFAAISQRKPRSALRANCCPDVVGGLEHRFLVFFDTIYEVNLVSFAL